MAETLLPCPFCNGKAEADYHQPYRAMSDGRLDHGAAIYCTSCNANMIACRGDHPELCDEQRMVMMVENWNRRDFSPMTIAAAVVAAVANAGWQPIATAPKDGTQIIGRTTQEEVFACNWFWDDEEKTEGDWLEHGTDVVRPREWLPMPANSFTGAVSGGEQ